MHESDRKENSNISWILDQDTPTWDPFFFLLWVNGYVRKLFYGILYMTDNAPSPYDLKIRSLRIRKQNYYKKQSIN